MRQQQVQYEMLGLFQDFKITLEAREINQVFATATSAIRNARNGQDLVNEIKAQTGISTRIISGTQEAELILEGVKNAMDLGTEKSLIMDIGGGSIEFIIANQDSTFWLRSFEVGGQRLVEKFHHTDPINRNEIDSLEKYLQSELEELSTQYQLHKPTTLVGCSGTFDTLSEIYQEKNGRVNLENLTEYPLPLDAFKNIYQELIEKNRDQRLQIPGMIEMRVDMIVVACVLINFLIEKFDLQSLRVSSYALKEGVLINTIKSLSK